MSDSNMSQPRWRIGLLWLLTTAVMVSLSANQAAMAGPLKRGLATEVVSARTLPMARLQGVEIVQDLAVSGQILVKLYSSATAAEFQETLRQQNCTILHQYRPYNLFLIGLPPGATVNEGLNQWRSQPGVALAEPDRLMYQMGVPNDPRYSEQYQWEITNAPAAWDIQQGSSQTVIAIIDSGVQLDHPDLQSKIWVNSGEIPNNGLDDDGNGFVDDVYGWDFWNNNNDSGPDLPPDPETWGPELALVAHGTHCAGLAAAASNNMTGVAGYDWQARIMSAQVFPPEGYTTDSVILEAFQYAVDNGADIISLSLGGFYTEVYTDPISQAFQQGIVVVAAAGNAAWVFTDDPSTWDSPVCNDGPMFTDNHVLGVAASDENDQAAYFTNRDASSRNFVDVTAPGVGILSTWSYFPGVQYLDVYYDLMDGTSMSTPIAAGLCGLIRAQFPSATAEGIITQIRAGCDNIDAENPMYVGTLGEGRINGANSLMDIPPGPARSVMAFDTPGDEGGSITVTWGKSTDDGRGFDDVTGYEVFKADSYDGPFTSLAQLDPGTTTYVDEPVPDAVPYYYKVAVSDASSTVESRVAGPAMARDDVPPDPVANVTTIDTPNDDGGSISVQWQDYDGPDDFAEFRIYRGTANFTDVSGMIPIGTLTRVTQDTYADTTTQDGIDYWYAVTAADDEDNENPTVAAAGPAVSYPNFTFNYPAGLSMISIGADPPIQDMAEILGVDPATLRLARWDPTLDDYHQYDPTNPLDPAMVHQLGRAFWLRTITPVIATVAGLPAAAGDFDVPILPDWNMLGNPYSADVDFGTAQVIYRGITMDLDTSNQQGYTDNYAWGYDSATNSYQLISAAFPFASSTIAKGQGVFFRSQVSGRLKLARPAGALAASKPSSQKSAPTRSDWRLQLVAKAARTADVDNFLGVSPQAAQLNNVISPPAAQPAVDLYFPAADGSQARGATDFVTSLSGHQDWQVAVACSIPGAQVELSWPDLTTVPHSIRPVLTDLVTGESVYLRTTHSYRYQAGEAGVRRFELTVSAGQSLLSLSSVTAAATPTGGVEVAFTLSAPGRVTVEVLNISGQRVRQLVGNKLYSAGAGVVAWDGRNYSGTLVPAGTYLVRLVAQAEDGQQVTALRPVSITR